MGTTTKRLRPEHPVDQMVTYELAEYRRDLEDALALETWPSYLESRDVLRARLDAVTAEQDERARIRANGSTGDA